MIGSDEENDQEQSEEFAYTTNAVTYILSAARCPTKFRDYIDCLIGIANGKIEFDATDKQIESRRKVVKSRGGKGVKEYWARDRRRGLLKWQKENDFYLLEYKEGDYDKKLNRRGPSHFKLYLVEYVQQVIAEAKKNKLFWDSDRAMAIKQAASKLVNELKAQTPEEEEDSYIDVHTEVIRKLKSAKTNIANALGYLEKYEFELSDYDEPLVTSIENLLAKIRKRGFAEFWDTKIITGVKRDDKP